MVTDKALDYDGFAFSDPQLAGILIITCCWLVLPMTIFLDACPRAN